MAFPVNLGIPMIINSYAPQWNSDWHLLILAALVFVIEKK